MANNKNNNNNNNSNNNSNSMNLHRHRLPTDMDGFERMATQTETSLAHVETTNTCRRRFLLGYLHVGLFVGLGLLLGLALHEASGHGDSTSCRSSPSILLPTETSQSRLGFHSDSQFPSLTSTSSDDRQVVFLMSFPNSGTSFTSKLVRHVSQMSTASNYGQENRDIYGNSIPVFPNRSRYNGPFWIDPNRNDVPEFSHPTKFVLTKTHCGGRCEKCAPEKYIENPHSFLHRCLSGSRVETTRDNITHVEEVTYQAGLVARAVHLIRNPFDNVVSRFHLELHSLAKKNNTEKLALFPNSKTGFRNFCEYLNAKHLEAEESSRWMDPRVYEIMKTVPCHADFFRWIQWHNLAFVTTQAALGIPSLIVHYEDYETRFDETLQALFDFLELDLKGEPPEFIKGKEYVEYFTKQEQAAVKEGIKALALASTWNNIYHYFE